MSIEVDIVMPPGTAERGGRGSRDGEERENSSLLGMEGGRSLLSARGRRENSALVAEGEELVAE